jgi:hypothetical protein
MMTYIRKKMLTTVDGTSRSYKIKEINLRRLKRYINRIKDNHIDGKSYRQ